MSIQMEENNRLTTYKKSLSLLIVRKTQIKGSVVPFFIHDLWRAVERVSDTHSEESVILCIAKVCSISALRKTTSQAIKTKAVYSP